jgi:hypothetical protein
MKKLITLSIPVIALVHMYCTDAFSVEMNELCETTLFADQGLSTRIDQFSVYDTVFLEVSCEVLIRDSYVISTQWMDETGNLQTEHTHDFLLGFPRPYSAVFKFKQMPKGSLKSMSTGDDFEEHQYGKWSVLSFINGEEIDRTFFTITQ